MILICEKQRNKNLNPFLQHRIYRPETPGEAPTADLRVVKSWMPHGYKTNSGSPGHLFWFLCPEMYEVIKQTGSDYRLSMTSLSGTT